MLHKTLHLSLAFIASTASDCDLALESGKRPWSQSEAVSIDLKKQNPFTAHYN